MGYKGFRKIILRSKEFIVDKSANQTENIRDYLFSMIKLKWDKVEWRESICINLDVQNI